MLALDKGTSGDRAVGTDELSDPNRLVSYECPFLTAGIHAPRNPSQLQLFRTGYWTLNSRLPHP